MKFYLMLIFFAISVPSLSLTNESFISQDTLRNKEYKSSAWADFGIGWSTRDLASFFSLNVELKKSFFITLSYDGAYSPAVPFPVLPIPVYSIEDGYDTKALSLKIGKLNKKKWGIITYSGGISSVKATKYEGITSAPESFSTIGLSLDARIMRAGRYVGIALIPFVNINPIKSYGGITISVALGRLIFPNGNSISSAHSKSHSTSTKPPPG